MTPQREAINKATLEAERQASNSSELAILGCIIKKAKSGDDESYISGEYRPVIDSIERGFFSPFAKSLAVVRAWANEELINISDISEDIIGEIDEHFVSAYEQNPECMEIAIEGILRPRYMSDSDMITIGKMVESYAESVHTMEAAKEYVNNMPEPDNSPDYSDIGGGGYSKVD